MNKEEFWEQFIETLEDKRAPVDIVLYDGRIIYNIAEAEENPEDEDEVILIPQWPLNVLDEREIVRYDQIKEIG